MRVICRCTEQKGKKSKDEKTIWKEFWKMQIT